MIQGVNGVVAVAPFVRPRATKVSSETGLVSQAERGGLVQVLVVFGTAEIPGGARAWLRAETATRDEFRQTVTIDGAEVVLLPILELRLVERAEPVVQTPTRERVAWSGTPEAIEWIPARDERPAVS